MQKPTLLLSSVLGLVALASAFTSVPASELTPVSPVVEAGTSRAYLGSKNLPAHGVAIDGYSPVSYFEGSAERGSPLFAVEHEGVTYHLASAAQVKTFQKNPAKYAPAFGGWCAFGMAVEDKFPVDPEAFAILDGELMLFLRNEGVDALELWNGGKEAELLGKARKHWKKVQG